MLENANNAHADVFKNVSELSLQANKPSKLARYPKMAACRRVPPLLLLMSILLYVHTVGGETVQSNGIVKPAVSADNTPKQVAVAPVAANAEPVDKTSVVAASPLRKRTTGWKLAEEPVCREDLTRLCPKNSWTNNLAVLECLQERKEVRWLAS